MEYLHNDLILLVYFKGTARQTFSFFGFVGVTPLSYPRVVAQQSVSGAMPTLPRFETGTCREKGRHANNLAMPHPILIR